MNRHFRTLRTNGVINRIWKWRDTTKKLIWNPDVFLLGCCFASHDISTTGEEKKGTNLQGEKGWGQSLSFSREV